MKQYLQGDEAEGRRKGGGAAERGEVGLAGKEKKEEGEEETDQEEKERVRRRFRRR